jgi:hypothetical protein
MPYYNMLRCILRIPGKARGAPQIPSGFEKWVLEVDKGTRKVIVTIVEIF